MGKKNGKKGNGNSKDSTTNTNGEGNKPTTTTTPITTTVTKTTITTRTISSKKKKKGGESENENENEKKGIHLNSILFYSFICFMLLNSLHTAYTIRLHSIKEYGPVIHEFDPYFNFRATEYLYNNGAKKFFTWFDHQSWYPLGRPVGTTIYPGMQFTAVFIKTYIVGDSMSLNDVCCYIPAWFGAIASFITGLITYECSLECNTTTQIIAMAWNLIAPKQRQFKERELVKDALEKEMKHKIALICGVMAVAIMAIVPAHMMRSVGGGYDNESIAISAMVMTFYFWVRSLRSGENNSYLYGILAGLAYFYMVAVWGGYVFVLNMIGLHAALLVGLGRFNTKIYLSYTLFYTIGTALAIQIPVVGWTPLKSLEQLGCLAVFLGYQILFITERMVKKRQLTGTKAWNFRIRLYVLVAVASAIIVSFLLPNNYFGPISSRVRGLFVKHTKTGNPLVDSVAEHQPAKANAYFQYLHQLCTFGPLGFVLILFYNGDSPSFLTAYALTAYYFSLKMVRLVLLIGPVSSILGGIAVGRVAVWSITNLFEDDENTGAAAGETSKNGSKKKKSKKGKAQTSNDDEYDFPDLKSDSFMNSPLGSWVVRSVSFVLLLTLYFAGSAFQEYSWSISRHLSNPAIIQKARKKDGTVVDIDDYREAYWWVRDNTPEDSRIMAWWDYGYQLASIANRTTIADGNTWNHEHIALLGKIFVTDVQEAHSIARHLADYILVWSGGGGDDLAKSPHLARIANSVYRETCPNDPVCSSFSLVPVTSGLENRAIFNGKMPSAKMHASLVNHLVTNGMRNVQVDPNLFEEVYRTKYGKVRIYKIVGADEKSKEWSADPKNKICDAPGSWFCRGQYPPALREVLDKGKTFVQLEDFNKKEEDTEYQKQYMESLRKQREKKENKAQKVRNIHSVQNDL